MKQHQHWPELDGLRAVAVVAVLLFHAAPHGPVPGGFLGVDLFFVLSAFLITTILSEELRANGSVNLLRFYSRRFFRLTPALVFFLAVYLAVAPLAWANYPHWRDALLTGTYLSDYSYTFWRRPFYLQHTWSLSVEEHFYLIWPVVLALVLRSGRPLLWLVAAYFAVFAWRYSFVEWKDYYYRFDTRATGLLVGASLALAPRPKIGEGAAWIALFVLVWMFAVARIEQAQSFVPLAELASAVLILFAIGQPSGVIRDMLNHPLAQFFGKRSYGIYLWHFPLAYFIRSSGFLVTAPIVLIVSVTMAELSYRTVEEWGRRMKVRQRAVPATV